MPSSQPGSQSELRASNRSRIIDLLRSRGPMSQAELARASGLSPATVSSIAHELRDEEWVVDEDLEGSRGRALALSRDAGLAVGIAFGHSHVRVAIADLAHTILAETEESLDTDHGSASEGIARAAALFAASSPRETLTSASSPASAWACRGRCAATPARSATRRSCPAGSPPTRPS